jgi:hypothetical protein
MLLPLLFLAAAAAASAQEPADQWLPDGAVTVLEVTRPAALVDLATELNIPQMLAGAGPESQALLPLVKLVTGGCSNITLATYPMDNTVVVLDGDGAAFDALQKMAQLAARGGTFYGARAFYKEYPGVMSWSFDGKQFFARAGNRLVIANRAETLKKLFEPRVGARLAASALYTEARKAAGDGGVVWYFANMAMLNQYPPAQKALAPADWMDLLLNGAAKQSLRGSKWLALSLRVDGRNLLLHAATDGKLDPTGAGEFSLPGAAGILPNLTVPRQLAGISLWRDLGRVYGAKDTLFPGKTSAGILAENFMEIFFTGRDLNAEVFGQFHPEVRLVVASQQFDPAIGTPQEQYPAAALIFKIDHAEEFGEVFEEAWQKAVGLANFTRGQSALPGLLMDKESHGGVPITYCYYSVRNEKDRAHLPARFNMRPALARVGPYLILSTTDALRYRCRQSRGCPGAGQPVGRAYGCRGDERRRYRRHPARQPRRDDAK